MSPQQRSILTRQPPQDAVMGFNAQGWALVLVYGLVATRAGAASRRGTTTRCEEAPPHDAPPPGRHGGIVSHPRWPRGPPPDVFLTVRQGGDEEIRHGALTVRAGFGATLTRHLGGRCAARSKGKAASKSRSCRTFPSTPCGRACTAGEGSSRPACTNGRRAHPSYAGVPTAASSATPPCARTSTVRRAWCLGWAAFGTCRASGSCHSPLVQ